MNSRKKVQNQETKFKIEKNIWESRKLFQNREIFFYYNREKIFGIDFFTDSCFLTLDIP